MKFKKVSISPELLFNMFTEGNKIRVDIINGIPKTAKYKKAEYDAYLRAFSIIFEDESFEEVKDSQIPSIDVIVKK